MRAVSKEGVLCMRITLFVTFFLFGLAVAALTITEFGDLFISLVERRISTISVEHLYDALLYVALSAFCFFLSFFCLKFKE